jgi:hypothetical protein
MGCGIMPAGIISIEKLLDIHYQLVMSRYVQVVPTIVGFEY